MARPIKFDMENLAIITLHSIQGSSMSFVEIDEISQQEVTFDCLVLGDINLHTYASTRQQQNLLNVVSTIIAVENAAESINQLIKALLS